jgi:hypothetical protein
MANRPPPLLADCYVNAGKDAPLRVFNNFKIKYVVSVVPLAEEPPTDQETA